MAKPATAFKTGAALLRDGEDAYTQPPLTRRQYYALHAPPAPDWWKVRNPLDEAHWRWTWADSMLKTEGWPTDPISAKQPPRPSL